MRSLMSLVFSLITFNTLSSQAQTSADSAAIRRAALDYVERNAVQAEWRNRL
jgi:hypothetical protein